MPGPVTNSFVETLTYKISIQRLKRSLLWKELYTVKSLAHLDIVRHLGLWYWNLAIVGLDFVCYLAIAKTFHIANLPLLRSKDLKFKSDDFFCPGNLTNKLYSVL